MSDGSEAASNPPQSWSAIRWLALFAVALVVAAPIIYFAMRGRTVAAVTVREIADGVWLHTTEKDLPGAPAYPANGLYVKLPDGVLLIDTGWTDAQAALLLDIIEKGHGPVRAVIVTHAHEDRMGGLAEVDRRGIPSYASERSAHVAASQHLHPPTKVFHDTLPLEQFGIAGEAFYPGPGHTDDNVVVWLEESKVLFGGCLIRAMDQQTRGNIEDANLAEWLRSVQAVIDRYPEMRIVVPGHGEPGGPELLKHTLEILNTAQ